MTRDYLLTINVLNFFKKLTFACCPFAIFYNHPLASTNPPPPPADVDNITSTTTTSTDAPVTRVVDEDLDDDPLPSILNFRWGSYVGSPQLPSPVITWCQDYGNADVNYGANGIHLIL